MGGDSNKKLLFSVKVGKSYKNKGWALNREAAISLFPKISYEEECDIVLDGIPSKAKVNIVPRIFYNKNEKIVNHLKNLADEGVERVDLELLLNHDEYIGNPETDNLLIEINNLNQELENKDYEINNLKDEIKYFKSFESKNKDVELLKLHEQIDELKKIIEDQESELDNLFNSVIQLEIDNEESFKKRRFYEEENKKLNRKLDKLFEIMSE